MESFLVVGGGGGGGGVVVILGCFVSKGVDKIY